jgi:NAD(P)H-hydrate epimerase
VLKGARTIVAHPWGETFFNLTGNHGLAKGGSGDVLTGIIVSFLAQGIPPLDAAVAGVWAHGRAADFAAEGRAKRTISAPDTAAALSEVFRLLGRD